MIAAIYARKSTVQEVADTEKSTARQIEHAKAYAKRKGWTVDDRYIYVDDGISGAEFANRPAFLRLMAAATQKPKPTHYKIVCISLYTEDIERLESLVAELKKRGHTKANKSAVIRYALDTIDLAKMPKGY